MSAEDRKRKESDPIQLSAFRKKGRNTLHNNQSLIRTNNKPEIIMASLCKGSSPDADCVKRQLRGAGCLDMKTRLWMHI